MLTNILSTKEINYNDDTFILKTSFDDSILLNSINKYGVINPLKIYTINNENIILSGYRRFSCALKLKINTLPCICYDYNSLSKKEAYKMALIDNFYRKYTDLEKALLIKKLRKDLNFDDPFFYYVLNNFLHIKLNDLSYYNSLLQLDSCFLELIHKEKLKKYQIEWIFTLNKDEQQFFINLLSKLYFTKSQFFEFINLINNICRIWDINLKHYIFYIPEIKELMIAIDRNKKNTFHLLESLKKYAYPFLSIIKYNFDLIISKLKLNNIKIVFPKYYEGNSLKIIFESKSYDDLKNQIKTLSNIINSQYILKLFEYMEKIFII